MKNVTEILKIKNVVKLSKTAVNILKIVCIVTIVVSSLIAVWASIQSNFELPTDKIPLQAFRTIEAFSYSTDNPVLSTRYMIIVTMMSYILYSIFVIIILKPLSKVLSTVIDGNPFEESNWKHISLIGWRVIISIILITFLQGLMGSVILGMIKVKGSAMIHTGIDWLLFFLTIFLGLLILIFAQVFKYGSYLQNEYDSTL